MAVRLLMLPDNETARINACNNMELVQKAIDGKFGNKKTNTVKYILQLILSSVFLISCSHYIVNQAGYIRPPENYRFTYRKRAQQLTGKEIIDTTAIYTLENSNFYRDSEQYKNGDCYIRFYADGRFKLQGTGQGIKLEDINDIDKGIVGYYQLRGNVIKLQIYTDLNAGSDQLEFGIVNENKDLILLNENPRTYFCMGYSEKAIKRKVTTSFLNPKVYKKTKIDGITYVRPDW